MIEFEMPMRTINPLNNRQHWRVVYKRGCAEKLQTKAALSQINEEVAFGTPAQVVLTRIGKRRMDKEAVGASLKHVQDAVAEWLGVDDGDESQVNFDYKQEIGKAFAVKVQIK